METYLIITLIVIAIFYVFGFIIYCLMDNDANNSNGFHTRNNRTRNYSYHSHDDQERQDTFVHLSSNNGHYDGDEGW